MSGKLRAVLATVVIAIAMIALMTQVLTAPVSEPLCAGQSEQLSALESEPPCAAQCEPPARLKVNRLFEASGCISQLEEPDGTGNRHGTTFRNTSTFKKK